MLAQQEPCNGYKNNIPRVNSLSNTRCLSKIKLKLIFTSDYQQEFEK